MLRQGVVRYLSLLAFIFACTLLPVWLPAQTPEQVFRQAVANGFSGEVLMAKQGKVLFHEAAGMRSFENQTPLRKGDLYEWASVSKQFTAMVILKLAAQQRLQLDDPVSKFLDIPYMGITVRHLLTHTSGLPDYQAIMDAHWDKSKVAGNSDILEYLNRYAPPRLFGPGEKYQYSNTGYVLLASIAEKVTGEDFIALSRKLIFDPAGMKRTHIRTLDEKAAAAGEFAVGHVKDSLGNWLHATRFRSSDYTIWLGNRKGPGRVSGPAEDLLKWDRALYDAGFIARGWLMQAYSPMWLNDGSLSSYGFGWDLDSTSAGELIAQHNGDNPGYKTHIARVPEKGLVLVVLNNNYFEGFSTLVKDLLRSAGLELPGN